MSTIDEHSKSISIFMNSLSIFLRGCFMNVCQEVHLLKIFFIAEQKGNSMSKSTYKSYFCVVRHSRFKNSSKLKTTS